MSRLQLARRSPLHLGQYFWPKQKNIDFYYRGYKTTQYVNEAIMRMHDPEDPVDTVVVSQPPRTGKSQLSQFHNSWYMGSFPHRSLLNTGYSDDLCAEFGAFSRDLLQEIGPEVFDITMSKRKTSRSDWELWKEGSERLKGRMRSVSILGQMTGYGFHHVTMDDLYKNYEDAHSVTNRRKVWNEIGSTVETRMQSPRTRLLIGTRWHRDDAIGRYTMMAENGDPNILVVNLPAIAKEDMYFPDGKRLLAKAGEALFPWQWTLEDLSRWKAKYGEYMYAALYMGEPTTPDGTFWEESLFNDIWFEQWPEARYRVDTIDPAHGAEVTKGCNSGIVSASTNTGHTYWLDAMIEPTSPVETIQRYEQFVDRTVDEGARFPDALVLENNGGQVEMLIDKIEAMKSRRSKVNDGKAKLWASLAIYAQDIDRDLGEELGVTNNKHVKIQTLDPYWRDKQFMFKSGSVGAATVVSEAKFYGASKTALVDAVDSLEMNSEFFSKIWRGEVVLATAGKPRRPEPVHAIAI